jgi:hypothetical protein
LSTGSEIAESFLEIPAQLLCGLKFTVGSKTILNVFIEFIKILKIHMIKPELDFIDISKDIFFQKDIFLQVYEYARPNSFCARVESLIIVYHF